MLIIKIKPVIITVGLLTPINIKHISNLNLNLNHLNNRIISKLDVTLKIYKISFKIKAITKIKTKVMVKNQKWKILQQQWWDHHSIISHSLYKNHMLSCWDKIWNWRKLLNKSMSHWNKCIGDWRKSMMIGNF